MIIWVIEMNSKQILELYDQQMRREITYPTTRREETPYVVRHISLEGIQNFVLYSSLSESNADDIIRGEIAYFEKLGRDVEWKVYNHDTPANLKARLAKYGFEVGEAEALMALDIENAPAFLLQSPKVPVRRITDPAQVDEILSVQRKVWAGEDYSDLGHQLKTDLQDRPEILSVYAVIMDGMPVSSAWIYYHPGTQFADLWGGATLPAYRGRGVYSSLLAARTQEARQRGFRFLTIDASPMSRPIVTKHGFMFLDHTYPCLLRLSKTE